MKRPPASSSSIYTYLYVPFIFSGTKGTLLLGWKMGHSLPSFTLRLSFSVSESNHSDRNIHIKVSTKEKGEWGLPFYWGVDSAEKVTKETYDCVLYNFGKPLFWGRYLSPIPGKVAGLTRDEAELLHNSGTKVLPIFSNFSRATGYRNGRVIAQNCVFHARRLGIPKGKIIFANLEKDFEIDEGWIRGFIDAMFPSGYKPGVYADPVHGEFSNAYCEAAARDEKVSVQLVIWSAEPEPGVTKARQAPKFNPHQPPCKANVWGWQYGRNSAVCPIDTNLFDRRLYDMLW